MLDIPPEFRKLTHTVSYGAAPWGVRRTVTGFEVCPDKNVIEPHKSGALHVHGLLGSTVSARCPNGLSRRKLKELWHEELGVGFAKVKPYRAGVSDRYVVKQVSYVAKDVRGSTGWKIFGPDPRLRDLPWKPQGPATVGRGCGLRPVKGG